MPSENPFLYKPKSQGAVAEKENPFLRKPGAQPGRPPRLVPTDNTPAQEPLSLEAPSANRFWDRPEMALRNDMEDGVPYRQFQTPSGKVVKISAVGKDGQLMSKEELNTRSESVLNRENTLHGVTYDPSLTPATEASPVFKYKDEPAVRDPKTSGGGAFLRGTGNALASSGATLLAAGSVIGGADEGFTNELMAARSAPASYISDIPEELDQKRNPFLYGAGQMTGTVAQAAAMGSALKGVGLVSKTAPAVQGTTWGARALPAAYSNAKGFVGDMALGNATNASNAAVDNPENVGMGAKLKNAFTDYGKHAATDAVLGATAGTIGSAPGLVNLSAKLGEKAAVAGPAGKFAGQFTGGATTEAAKMGGMMGAGMGIGAAEHAAGQWYDSPSKRARLVPTGN